MLSVMSDVSPSAVAQPSWSTMFVTWINSRIEAIHRSSPIDPLMVSTGSDLMAVEASNIRLYVTGYFDVLQA